MGVVKIDIYKEGLEWYNVSLSDSDSVKGLLKLRGHFDLLFESRSNDPLSSNVDLSDQIEEVTCVYANLDKIISKINFTNQQNSILKRYVNGYTVEEIAEEDKQSVRNINGVLDTICKNISNEAERQWRKWSYTHKLGLKSKKCSKCREELPATNEFFRPRNDGKSDGFYGRCRKCENELDRVRKTR